MSITQYTVRVANYIDGAGNEFEFTTSTGARRNLATSPTIAGASLGILDPIASSGGMMWELIGTPAALQPLTRRDLEHPLGALGPVRLREFCTNTDVSIVLDRAGLTTPQFVFIGSETMRLDSETSPGVYAVTRAIGSLGVARTHQWLEESQPQPLMLARPSNPTGMRVSVEDQTGLVYRGVLRSASRTDHGCALDIVSMVGWLRERRQSPVDGRPYSTTYNSMGINAAERTVNYPYGYYDSWAPQRVRIWVGDVWIVVAAQQPVGLYGNEIYGVSFDTPTPILQWGKGDTAYTLNNPPKELAEAVSDWLDSSALIPTRLESLYTTPQAAPSVVLQAMLTADWPPGQVAGMDPSDVGNLSALDDAYGVGNMTPPYCDDPGALWWPGGNKGSVMLADAIAQNFMAPLLCGMTADAFGRIMVIDWLRCLGGTEAIIETDLMRGLGAVGDTMPVRIVRWTQTELSGEQVLNFQSDLVSQVVGGGREIAVKPGWLQNAAGWMYDRLSAALQIYQLSVPMLTITMTAGKAASINLEPGLVVGLTCSTLWNRQGLRGVSDIDGIVVGITRRLASEGGTIDAVLALTGYSVQANVGKWAPSGRVVSAVGSIITMTMDNGDDVDQWFTAGVAVALAVSAGFVLDASLTVTSSNATSITVSGLGVGVAPGDRIELATYSVAQYPDAAYYGEGFDYV